MRARLDTLERATPEAVRLVCRRLREGGHQAWAVGGAVRDALLGRPAGDWDVATSALPDQVIGLFRRTIPTGIQHGTVTVLVPSGLPREAGGGGPERDGRGEARAAIEVTTFRGEGAYSDARRPDTVHFGVSLDEDLARRDLVVNAMAWDPIDRVLHDPYGGLADLQARRLRAVGDPAERFREDGLRVMRAVRFAAQLEFVLDAETEAAIAPALPSLARVSMERVHDELWKLLEAPRPSLGLEIALRTGILATVMPELQVDRGLVRVDAAARLVVRLAALLVDLSVLPEPADVPLDALADEAAATAADVLLRRLKAANVEREGVVRLVRFGRGWRRANFTPGELRRFLSHVGRTGIPDLLALWAADQAALDDTDPRLAHIAALADRVRDDLEAGYALGIGELAIKGGDVMRVLGIPPGRQIGELLERLLDRVLEDPALNTRDRLEALVSELRQK